MCWEYSFRTGSKRLNHQRSCLNVTPDPPPYKTSIASQFSKLHTCSSDCLLEQLKRQSPTFPWFSKQQNYIFNKPILSIVGKLTEQLKNRLLSCFERKSNRLPSSPLSTLEAALARPRHSTRIRAGTSSTPDKCKNI